MRGYSVDVGVIPIAECNQEGKVIRKQLEVDFVCNLGSSRYYIQSAYSGNQTIQKDWWFFQENRCYQRYRSAALRWVWYFDCEHLWLSPWSADSWKINNVNSCCGDVKLNVSRQAISPWESGTAMPDASNIPQLSKLLDVIILVM